MTTLECIGIDRNSDCRATNTGGDEKRMDSSHDYGSQSEDADYGFLAVTSDIEDDNESGDSVSDVTTKPSNELGGNCQYFGGLAVAPLTSLMRKLSSSPLSEEDVMKLRSIMRFSIEYHNPLVVHSQNLPAFSPTKQFAETASECFQVLYKIIVALSETNMDASLVAELCDNFRLAHQSLVALKDQAKEEVDCTTLRQSISAVQGQMKDFATLIQDSILPNL